MKLTEIKQLNIATVDLMEGVIPPHLTMTLGQVIRDGRVSNSVQTFIMADLVAMFKNGGPTRWPRELNPYPMNAGTDMINAVKSLAEEDKVDLAAWLLTELNRPATFESNPYHPFYQPNTDTVEWVKWVLKRQF